MPADLVVPQLGESISEGEILSWLKADGDTVAVDEILLELETDKTTVELPSPAAGVLRIVKPAGSVVQIGEVLAHIEDAGAAATPAAGAQEPGAQEPAAASTADKPAAGPKASASKAPGAAPGDKTASPVERASRPSAGAGDAAATAAGEASPSVPRMGPAARRAAEEAGVPTTAISGSGPGGRATKSDVARAAGDATATRRAPDAATPAAANAPERESAPAVATAQEGPAPGDDGEERIRMTRLRRTIAERLVAAQHTAAILTTFNEIDMGGAMEMRARHKERFQKAHGVSLGFMSIFARACVLALRDVPLVGARLDGDDIVLSRRVHLGIAASTERGLVVPVVRNADLLTLAGLEQEVARLAGLARDGKLGVEDLSGGTFTISNGGVFGSLLSTPILNPPQSGILGMHKIEKRPVVVDDQIVIRPMMYVALSYDHRIVDGRDAVTFLVRVKERIEDPARLLLEV